MKIIDEIKKIAINKVYAYHNNPKEHSTEQIDKIASSIKNYGFTVPIVIDGDNEIIAGHARLKAAKKLGLSEIPCVIRGDLNDAQKRAFRIADNRIAESEWNYEQLAEEFDLLEMQDQELKELTGFEVDEIEHIQMTEIDMFDDVGDLEDEYEEPEDNQLICPSCGEVNSKESFKEV